ncbi:MAG TPA: ATPase domain-containing protein [Thermoplasmata archaeon]|nr:ATPase domain-containing protein [Thermoplasmata archaeon]
MNVSEGSVPTEPEPESPVAEARISTGNPHLDEILRGGLVAHRPYLIVGPCGTGKTKLALQFLCEGIRRGEKVLLVTLEDPPNEMRINHRGMQPELDRIFVFDAIPDVMRYERAPFKDIAAVRSSVLFSQVAPEIRKTAELVSVEVTFSALEQTLKMEMVRQGYSRLVVDSLTALQYFCMKGIDETQGAQSFLRFLSDLRVTALLTVEAPVEEVESAERLLARGEIRLFRWELEGRTVRAIGVEKFRGSAHDNRLHPYRISPTGLDIDLETTISRDTRRVVEPAVAATAPPEPDEPARRPAELGQILSDLRDLAALGIDVGPAQSEVADARAAAQAQKPDEVGLHLIRARAIVSELAQQWNPRTAHPIEVAQIPASDRVVRIATEAGDLRAGGPPPRKLESWSGAAGPSLAPPVGRAGIGELGPAIATPEAAVVPVPPALVAQPEADPVRSPKPAPSEPPPPPPRPEVAGVTGPAASMPSATGGTGPRGVSLPAGPAPDPGVRGRPPPPLPGSPTGTPVPDDVPLGEKPPVGPAPAEAAASPISAPPPVPKAARARPPLPEIPRPPRGPLPPGPSEPTALPPAPSPTSGLTTPGNRAPGERTPTAEASLREARPVRREKVSAGRVPTSSGGALPSAESETSVVAEPSSPTEALTPVPTSEPVPVPREVLAPPRVKRPRASRKAPKPGTVTDGPTPRPRRRAVARRAAPPVTGAAQSTPPPDLTDAPRSSELPASPPPEGAESDPPKKAPESAASNDPTAPEPSRGEPAP